MYFSIAASRKLCYNICKEIRLWGRYKMIIEKRIKEFEKLGFGLFVHFGMYSEIGKGEWMKFYSNAGWEEYHKALETFNNNPG